MAQNDYDRDRRASDSPREQRRWMEVILPAVYGRRYLTATPIGEYALNRYYGDYKVALTDGGVELVEAKRNNQTDPAAWVEVHERIDGDAYYEGGGWAKQSGAHCIILDAHAVGRAHRYTQPHIRNHVRGRWRRDWYGRRGLWYAGGVKANVQAHKERCGHMPLGECAAPRRCPITWAAPLPPERLGADLRAQYGEQAYSWVDY